MSPLPKPTQSDEGGIPFLKAATIGEVKAKATLTLQGGVSIEDGQFGEQCIVPVRYDDEDYQWAFKSDSPNYRKLFARFGDNETKWRGDVEVEVKVWNGKLYLAVTDAPKSAGTRKRGK